MAWERDLAAAEAPLQDQLAAVAWSVRKRWLVLGTLVLAVCAALAWTGVNLIAPVRRYRERALELCRKPLSAEDPSKISYGQLTVLGGAWPAGATPVELVETERALFLVKADGRPEVLADRCRKASGPGGDP